MPLYWRLQVSLLISHSFPICFPISYLLSLPLGDYRNLWVPSVAHRNKSSLGKQTALLKFTLMLLCLSLRVSESNRLLLYPACMGILQNNKRWDYCYINNLSELHQYNGPPPLLWSPSLPTVQAPAQLGAFRPFEPLSLECPSDPPAWAIPFQLSHRGSVLPEKKPWVSAALVFLSPHVGGALGLSVSLLSSPGQGLSG